MIEEHYNRIKRDIEYYLNNDARGVFETSNFYNKEIFINKIMNIVSAKHDCKYISVDIYETIKKYDIEIPLETIYHKFVKVSDVEFKYLDLETPIHAKYAAPEHNQKYQRICEDTGNPFTFWLFFNDNEYPIAIRKNYCCMRNSNVNPKDMNLIQKIKYLFNKKFTHEN